MDGSISALWTSGSLISSFMALSSSGLPVDKGTGYETYSESSPF